MEPVAISWLVASSASPLVAVLALWTIYVFHTYRRRWRTVDLFLLAATSQELIVSVFTFCYAIVSLINPPFRAPCNFVQWGLVSTRTFQMATLASMVADRSLTVRWPYRYRFSVRRNQIRYHVAVLALVSVLVGVAAVFARSPHHLHHNAKSCFVHPVQWDVRYTVFVEALYAVLVLVTLGCAVQIEVHRRRHRTLKGGGGSFQLPECVSPELPSANGMSSPLDTQSSTGSTRALHRPSRQASRRPYGRHSKGASDLRWAPVGLAALLCFAINHVPYMVWTGVVAWRPALWSPWLEAALSWLRLLEGLLLPLLLFARDRPLRAALGRAFQRRSGTLSPLVGEDGPFQMYFDKDHFRKRGTFGAVAPVGIITNYRRAPGSGKRQRSGGGRYALPGLRGADSVLGGGGGEPLSKLSCADLTSLGMWREEEEEEENFYATLSDDFSTFSCRSADDSAISEDVRVNEELYGGSFTTLANDDFEFHDTRPCGGEVRMRPALAPPPPTYPSSNVSFRDHLQQKADNSSHIPFDKSRDLFEFVDQSDEIRKDPRIFMMPLPPPPSDPPKEDVAIEPFAKETNKFGTMSRHQKATSYSMNDLDLIHSGLNARPDEEATFVLPVKSESTMSLYRLNMDRDLDQLLLSPSRSETNVHSAHNGDDSGFGSGVRSAASPVWSGFLCRKPSDPFWNMRRPPCEGVLHPRMRKIPWITAWKKLGESSRQSHRASACVQQNLCGWSESSRPAELDQSKQCNGGIYGWSECGGSRPVEHDQQQQSSRVYGWSECGVRASQQQGCGWKDNVVYGDTKNGILMREKIEEELSDVSTPVSPGDYNLDIFAKESGVLLENAYGKIVRDHCGVQVNFYGSRENPLYQGNDGFSGAAPEADRDVKRGEIYQPVNGFHRNVPESSSKEVIYNARAQAVENLFCRGAGNANDNDIFRCELRLNGGHYENLFGTKENIFAQCDQYFDRSSKQKGPNLPSQLEMRESGHRGHRDSGRFKQANNNNLLSDEASAIYGQLRMVERKDSVNRGNENVKTKEINCNLLRKDSKSNKCGIKRKESKNKDDRNGKGVVRRESKERKDNLETNTNSDDLYKNRIEIRLQEDCARNDLSRRDSQSRNARPEVRNNLSPLRRNSSERRRNVNIEQNHNLQVGYLQDEVPVEKKPIRLERKKSQNRKQLEEEIANREDRNAEGYPRKHYQDSNRISARVQNEGLWVNAEPFVVENLNERYEGSKDKLQRESRKDIHDLQIGTREQDVHGKQVDLVRKESKTKADKPKHPIRRKSSATRGRRYHSEPSEGAARTKDEAPTRGIKRKESMGRKDKPEDNARWSQSIENELRPDEIENFVKYRDKCEGNFSHIQNLNRETSTERESCRLENLIYGGKSNAEIFPFETFQEPKQRVHPFAHRTVLDVNDNNCRQKKLAITDFL